MPCFWRHTSKKRASLFPTPYQRGGLQGGETARSGGAGRGQGHGGTGGRGARGQGAPCLTIRPDRRKHPPQEGWVQAISEDPSLSHSLKSPAASAALKPKKATLSLSLRPLYGMKSPSKGPWLEVTPRRLWAHRSCGLRPVSEPLVPLFPPPDTRTLVTLATRQKSPWESIRLCKGHVWLKLWVEVGQSLLSERELGALLLLGNMEAHGEVSGGKAKGREGDGRCVFSNSVVPRAGPASAAPRGGEREQSGGLADLLQGSRLPS